ncbi:elongation of very long chain fatty acids protein F-like [Drosophila willistoni]|uniref:elongation of very long chain fatty acids protein F-like n=1 Tax=Drosophila willistoni TaxID=7260 RepID=UPI000C26C2AA|nr:elongation of very long chain fatty acids protein F-like [Drosophila willistoni]
MSTSVDPVELPLMTSLWSVVFILLAYVIFVFKVGKDWMKNRRPYNVQKPMLIYNAFQIVYNVTLLCNIFHMVFIKQIYNFRCMESLPLDHPEKRWERLLSYFYFLNKVCDLMDTIFFVLRKSYKQITVLHVFHHISMVLFFPIFYPKFGAGGEIVSMGMCNTFVHSLMYTYYFISALFPNMKGIEKWKKLITISQMVQFLICHLHGDIMFIFYPECKLYGQHLLLMGMSTAMFIMFANFYHKAYMQPKSKNRE